MAFEYRNTFIRVADDRPVDHAIEPPAEYRGKPTVAAQEFQLMHGRDFEQTMSAVLSEVWGARKSGDEPREDERAALVEEYFPEVDRASGHHRWQRCTAGASLSTLMVVWRWWPRTLRSTGPTVPIRTSTN